MQARIVGTYKKGEPILVQWWRPHDVWAVADYVYLEEVDQWRGDCFKEKDLKVPYRCPYPESYVSKVVATALKDKAPDVYRVMKNLAFSQEEIGKLCYRHATLKEDMKAIASEWIKANQPKINQWLGK